MVPLWKEILKPYIGAKALNLGCGQHPEISENGTQWVNLDMASDGGADVVHDLHDLPLPFPNESFDTIFSCHVLEHVDRDKLVDLVHDCSRMLKIGGHFIAIVPHGSHPNAWENPHHRQLFSETTFAYFDRRIYEVPDNVGTGAHQNHKYAVWSMQLMSRTPDERYIKLPVEEIERLMVERVGIIKELQAVMRLEGR